VKEIITSIKLFYNLTRNTFYGTCISAQCVAFRMPKQVVMYWGRNFQRCKQS